MIASIEGNVTHIAEDHIVVSVSGVGFKILSTPQVRKSLDLFSKIVFYTFLLVREDALTLFGFLDVEERDMFVQLIGVSGVGPKTALSIISSMSTEKIQKAVIQNQPELFDGVTGVGKKTAQSIVLNLQGKLEKGLVGSLMPMKDIDNDVISALTGLGYSVIEAQSAIQLIPKETPSDLETRIRIALQQLG
jgi:Holliday junction DNA helicase RuvA